MLSNDNALKKGFFDFYTIFWWLFVFAFLLLSFFESLNQFVLKIIVPLSLLIVIAKQNTSGLRNNTGLKLYIALSIWACLSLVYTVNMTMTMNYLQTMAGNIIIWYITFSCMQQINDIRLTTLPLFIALLFHLYFGFANPSVEIYEIDEIEINQLTGLTNNPNALAFLLWDGLIMSVILLFNSQKNIFKLVYILAIGLFIYGIFSAGSRKTLFATLIFGATLIFLTRKSKNYVLFIAIIIIASISYDYLYTYILENTTVGARLSEELLERGADRRGDLIGEGWRFFLANPIIGIGLGSFTTYSEIHAMSHNDYIEILASMGFIALAIYLAIFIDFWKKGMKYIYKNSFVAISISFLAGYLFLGMGRPTFLDPYSILIFAFFQGLLEKQQRQKTPFPL